MPNSQTQTSLSPAIHSPTFKILLIARPSKLINLLKLELSHEGYEMDIEKPSSLTFEDLRLDTSIREVYLGDRYIYLTTKEFALLEYLLAYPRQVLTRTQILDSVWGYEYTRDSNIIEVYVRYLRLKLEEDDSKRLIYTVRSIGYVLRESSFFYSESDSAVSTLDNNPLEEK